MDEWLASRPARRGILARRGGVAFRHGGDARWHCHVESLKQCIPGGFHRPHRADDGDAGRHRYQMTLLLAAVYAVAADTPVSLRLARRAWHIAVRGATLTTVGILRLGVPFNLFTLLALWLVLGLGIDYGIFLRHGRDPASRRSSASRVRLHDAHRVRCCVEATPFIRSIGLTLLFAITLSWLFALLACMTENEIHG